MRVFIVRIARPKKVLLFGSQANGTATCRSDLDFMIVVSDDVLHVRALRSLLNLEISSLIGAPCDVLEKHTPDDRPNDSRDWADVVCSLTEIDLDQIDVCARLTPYAVDHRYPVESSLSEKELLEDLESAEQL